MRVLETIEDYNLLGAMLNDIHYSPEQKNCRIHEGMGSV